MTAAQLKSNGSATPVVHALDVSWASVLTNVYSMYGDPYYGSWGYNPAGYSYGNVYTGPQFAQGYDYSSENPWYASDPYTQWGADLYTYGASSYSQGLYPDYPIEVAW